MIGLIIAGAILAVPLALAAVGAFLSCWYSVPYSEWVQYERERRRRKRRKRDRTCDTCKRKPQCDIFFTKRYQKLDISEPEGFKTMACKLYQKKED